MSDDQNDPDEHRENPYVAPAEYEVTEKRYGGSTLEIVVLAILIVPATVIAGFTTCYGIGVASPLKGEAKIVVAVIVGLSVAIVIFVLILIRILEVSRKRAVSKRTPPSH